MAISHFTLILSVLNFVGSVLSSIGSGFIILCYLVLPVRQHFRHVLILNLAVADFINSANNSASGSLILIRKENLRHGPGCIFNGFITQISVQATDTAILAITLVTVYTITRTSHSRMIRSEWSPRTILLITAAIWTLPVLTSFLALGKDWYGPVSGNWCWLVEKPPYLRYVLTHGWRYLFMLIEVGLSVYLHIYLRRHFRDARVPLVSSTPTHAMPLPPMAFAPNPSTTTREEPAIQISQETSQDFRTIKHDDAATYSTPDRDSHTLSYDKESVHHLPSAPSIGQPQLNRSENHRYKAIQRILLLNAYPLFYILLWIPGLANRVVEATGHSSRVTQVMQASTQFVGLANAITYGWNERVARELRRRYLRRPADSNL